MSLSLSEMPGKTITNALYLVFHTKTWFKKKISSHPRFHTTSQEFVDTRMSHWRSLKLFCFGSISIFLICYGTCQSVDEGISDKTILKKILETSYGKMLNPVYQN